MIAILCNITLGVHAFRVSIRIPAGLDTNAVPKTFTAIHVIASALLIFTPSDRQRMYRWTMQSQHMLSSYIINRRNGIRTN